MLARRRLGALLATLLLGAAPVYGQARSAQIDAVRTLHGAPSALAHAQRSGGSAFLIEALGGTAGAFAGGGILLLTRNNCESEDLSCLLDALALAGVGSIIGATAGSYLAGRSAATHPSLLGAGLGAVIGLAAGVGV